MCKDWLFSGVAARYHRDSRELDWLCVHTLQKHGAVAYHHFFVYNLRIRYHSHHLISLDSQKHQRIGGLMNGIDILVVCSTLGTLIVMWVGILIICLKNA